MSILTRVFYSWNLNIVLASRRQASHITMIEFKQRQTNAVRSTLANSNELKDSNFFNSFKPIYYFSRVFGLLPYSIVCDPKGVIQGPCISRLDISWFIISLSVYLFAALASFQYMDYEDNALNILVLCDNYHLTLGLGFDFLLIVDDMCKRFKFVDLLKKFNSFDNEVNSMDDT